jgi:hypothetical protein
MAAIDAERYLDRVPADASASEGASEGLGLKAEG